MDKRPTLDGDQHYCLGETPRAVLAVLDDENAPHMKRMQAVERINRLRSATLRGPPIGSSGYPTSPGRRVGGRRHGAGAGLDAFGAGVVLFVEDPVTHPEARGGNIRAR